jgi:hypothetical protein
MDRAYLKTFVIQKKKEFPHLHNQILDFYYLAHDEIEDGGSEAHEVHLAISSIEQLIIEEGGNEKH